MEFILFALFRELCMKQLECALIERKLWIISAYLQRVSVPAVVAYLVVHCLNSASVAVEVAYVQYQLDRLDLHHHIRKINLPN